MSISHRRRLLVAFISVNLGLLALAAYAVLQRPIAMPPIQGVLMEEARPVPEFELIDHQGAPFDNDDLQGEWHLVTYGFTTCPDICPTTLSELNRFNQILEQRGVAPPQVLFYSVDHRRDTPAQLASYLPFFNPEFVGLTHRDDPANKHLAFERGLGIAARLEPLDNSAESIEDNAYRVSHGVTLLLLNPSGELRAVFKPERSATGIPAFDSLTLAEDYIAVRNHLR